MTIKGVLTKRPYWMAFAACQIVGCVLLFTKNDFGTTAGLILLLAGSFIIPAVAGLVAMFLGGWDAVPVWLWFVVIPTILLAVNFVTWYVPVILSPKKTARATNP